MPAGAVEHHLGRIDDDVEPLPQLAARPRRLGRQARLALALDERLQGPDEMALHDRYGRVIPDHPPAVLHRLSCLGDGLVAPPQLPVRPDGIHGVRAQVAAVLDHVRQLVVGEAVVLPAAQVHRQGVLVTPRVRQGDGDVVQRLSQAEIDLRVIRGLEEEGEAEFGAAKTGRQPIPAGPVLRRPQAFIGVGEVRLAVGIIRTAACQPLAKLGVVLARFEHAPDPSPARRSCKPGRPGPARRRPGRCGGRGPAGSW